MTYQQGSWVGDELTAKSFLKPHQVARAVFHPRWIPESLDPTVEQLKRIRVIGGAVAALGVYTFVEGGFAFDEMLDNAVTASVVLFFLTPLTVGVMLWVWRRTGTVRQLKGPLFNALKLLMLFIGAILSTVLLFRIYGAFGLLAQLVLTLVGLWMAVFVIAGAVKLSGNFFGTAVVHRCLPPLLATVTTWLMAIPDLVTGDLHGLSLTMGVVFILGAPVTVTAISVLEMRRLRQRYGIRLGVHPAALPPLPPPPPPYAPGPRVPPQGNPYGNPYGTPSGNPYGTPSGNPYGNPYGR
ncbi:hypothetical protein [Streptomyces griseosporeus]|uniref:hypothetical protein n=1 Tax=Streptomyces griseosporeus TaxID=1910 RepID=UPI00167D24A5|nr:hypothetical protein [Streptomyces griseosporeus]GHF88907.1 hypothetical protein GCM10018783_69330 [Streptomyces griseosporeus]